MWISRRKPDEESKTEQRSQQHFGIESTTATRDSLPLIGPQRHRLTISEQPWPKGALLYSARVERNHDVGFLPQEWCPHLLLSGRIVSVIAPSAVHAAHSRRLFEPVLTVRRRRERSRTSGVASTWPGNALPITRAAVFTVSPIAV